VSDTFTLRLAGASNGNKSTFFSVSFEADIQIDSD